MSRLADALTGLDKKAPRVQPLGSPALAASRSLDAAKWRRRVLFAMVVLMLAITAAMMARQAKVARIAPLSTPVVTAPRQVPVQVGSMPVSEERAAALRSRGLQMIERDDLAEAAALFERALELRPNDSETWNSLGVALVRRGQIAAGIDAFTRALRISPDDAAAHRNLAVALDRHGKPEAAAAHYAAFLRLARADQPDRPDVQRRLAEISVSKSRE